jgi:four helix bundle protein
VRDHRSLLAWQKAAGLTRWAVRANVRFWRPPLRVLFDRLLRSALDVQLHIAEGLALRTNESFKRHLRRAYGAVVEAIDLLRLLEEAHLVPSQEVVAALKLADEARANLLGLMRKYRRLE